MPAKRYISVKEPEEQLKKLIKSSPSIFIPRLRMLLIMKQQGQAVLSKRTLAEQTGVDPNSIQKWRNCYERDGLDALLSHKRTGFKPSLISSKQHQSLDKILSNEQNGMPGYTELLVWFNQTHSTKLEYQCLYKYCRRHFNTKIKVARKSHVNKDKEAVMAFKKTLVKSS